MKINFFKPDDLFGGLDSDKLQEDEAKKKKTPQSCTISKLPNGDIESSGGFKFADQSIIDIIASCFGSKESEAKLKKIHDHAEKIADTEEKKRYIEKEVRDHAQEIDCGVSLGMKSNFEIAKGQYANQVQSGKIKQGDKIIIEDADAGKDQAKKGMFGVMRGLGLNVDGDNCTTSYQEGAGGNPKVFSMVFVKKPTRQMADQNSVHNHLADQYAATLDSSEKKSFDQEREQLTRDAEAGGPKIAVEEFKNQADQISNQVFQDTVNSTVKPELKEVAKALSEGERKVGGYNITGIGPADLFTGKGSTR